MELENLPPIPNGRFIFFMISFTIYKTNVTLDPKWSVPKTNVSPQIEAKFARIFSLIGVYLRSA